VPIGLRRRAPAVCSTDDEAFLQQIRLDDVFEGFCIFRQTCGNCADPGWTTTVLLDDGLEKSAIETVEPQLVDAFTRQRLIRNVGLDTTVGTHFGKITHAPQQTVGDPWRSSATSGDRFRALGIDRYTQETG
jgi:hypothetical protein